MVGDFLDKPVTAGGLARSRNAASAVLRRLAGRQPRPRAPAGGSRRALKAKGGLEVSRLDTTAIGRKEQFLVVSACDDEERALEEGVANRLFTLRGELIAAATGSAPTSLGTQRDEQLGRRRSPDAPRGSSAATLAAPPHGVLTGAGPQA